MIDNSISIVYTIDMIKKLISFPQTQIDYIESRCKKFGLPFAEYIRKLVMIEMMEQESYSRMKRQEGNAFKNFAERMNELKDTIYTDLINL